MSESFHAQLLKVLPLLLLLLSSPSPSIPLKWYFIVLAVSADTADTVAHVTNAAWMLDNGNNWMAIYVKYNWDFIEIMPLIRLDSAACKVKSVLCHLFVIFLQQFVSVTTLSCPSAPPVWESSNRTPCVTHTLQYPFKIDIVRMYKYIVSCEDTRYLFALTWPITLHFMQLAPCSFYPRPSAAFSPNQWRASVLLLVSIIEVSDADGGLMA